MAQKDLIRAVELNPRLTGARLILARSYLRERNLDLARQEIKEVFGQEKEEAKAALKKALELNKELPGHKEAQHTLADMSYD